MLKSTSTPVKMAPPTQRVNPAHGAGIPIARAPTAADRSASAESIAGARSTPHSERGLTNSLQLGS
jgi:hypothetical protein